MTKLNTHIIRTIIGAGLDKRDKVNKADANAEAVTNCGIIIPINNRQRIARLGEGDPMLLCDECLSRLMLIE